MNLLYLSFQYILIPLVLFLIALIPALWWLPIWRGDFLHRVIVGTMALIMILASTYEVGYKKNFCRGNVFYFYIVYVPVSLFAAMGFFIGIVLTSIDYFHK